MNVLLIFIAVLLPALLAAVLFLAVLVVQGRTTPSTRGLPASAEQLPADASTVELVDALRADVLGLRQEVAALQAVAQGALRNVSVVRYDAFDDMGGQLSWSVALLDLDGNGVVISSIHGRSEARSYVRTISRWNSEAPLSDEETEAVARARG